MGRLRMNECPAAVVPASLCHELAWLAYPRCHFGVNESRSLVHSSIGIPTTGPILFQWRNWQLVPPATEPSLRAVCLNHGLWVRSNVMNFSAASGLVIMKVVERDELNSLMSCPWLHNSSC